MDLLLTRTQFRSDGIFGEITDSSGSHICFTLEHAFRTDSGDWAPIVPENIYLCKRGMHRLEHMTEDFEAFEVMDVPDHTGILLHVGNKNSDSSGCILLGSRVLSSFYGQVLAESKEAFDAFMALQKGLDSFELTIVKSDNDQKSTEEDL